MAREEDQKLLGLLKWMLFAVGCLLKLYATRPEDMLADLPEENYITLFDLGIINGRWPCPEADTVAARVKVLLQLFLAFFNHGSEGHTWLKHQFENGLINEACRATVAAYASHLPASAMDEALLSIQQCLETFPAHTETLPSSKAVAVPRPKAPRTQWTPVRAMVAQWKQQLAFGDVLQKREILILMKDCIREHAPEMHEAVEIGFISVLVKVMNSSRDARILEDAATVLVVAGSDFGGYAEVIDSGGLQAFRRLLEFKEGDVAVFGVAGLAEIANYDSKHHPAVFGRNTAEKVGQLVWDMQSAQASKTVALFVHDLCRSTARKPELSVLVLPTLAKLLRLEHEVALDASVAALVIVAESSPSETAEAVDLSRLVDLAADTATNAELLSDVLNLLAQLAKADFLFRSGFTKSLTRLLKHKSASVVRQTCALIGSCSSTAGNIDKLFQAGIVYELLGVSLPPVSGTDLDPQLVVFPRLLARASLHQVRYIANYIPIDKCQIHQNGFAGIRPFLEMFCLLLKACDLLVQRGDFQGPNPYTTMPLSGDPEFRNLLLHLQKPGNPEIAALAGTVHRYLLSADPSPRE